ncbi:MAG: sugar ABC transporter permease [Caldilineaceae bacterium SB0668_bin_21]|nr:sugar ABC transporter permease [Caldilineaceae bacterium]MCY3994022.1 sugar ABC transporter permease [Caldilineaceae bacterium]MXX24352.1 sugar ABC transporter permease [Caldilineaceae bacterium SB0668_bin_21]MYC21133.1 sugar ABC transporter permease [Caldilineaceae bacterium SB0662_bin_25]
MAQSQVLTRLVAKTKTREIRWHRYEGYLFVAPLLIGIVAFIFLPIAASLYMSFHTWDMVSPPELVGLKNYARLVSRDRLFWKVLGNTFKYAGWIIVPSVTFPLILAALLDRPIRLRYLYRLAFFLPLVTSVVAVGLMFRWLYDGEFGLINYTLSWVRIDGPNWLSDVFWAMPAVAMVTVWQGLGYNMVLYLAGLQGIPDHLYEAATIDGAGPLSRFFKITIPLLTPTMFFILVMSVIGTFQTFGLIYVMTQGGPINSTNVYIYYLWQMAFGSSKMGYASAMAWILAMVIFTITMIQVRLARLWVHY